MKPDHPKYGIEPMDQFGILHYEEKGTSVREEVKAAHGEYMKYYDGVYRAIAEDIHVPVSGEDGLRVMKVIEAAFRSHSEKRVIDMV